MEYGLQKEPEGGSEVFEVLAGVFGDAVFQHDDAIEVLVAELGLETDEAEGRFSRLIQEGCITRC